MVFQQGGGAKSSLPPKSCLKVAPPPAPPPSASALSLLKAHQYRCCCQSSTESPSSVLHRDWIVEIKHQQLCRDQASRDERQQITEQNTVKSMHAFACRAPRLSFMSCLQQSGCRKGSTEGERKKMECKWKSKVKPGCNLAVSAGLIACPWGLKPVKVAEETTPPGGSQSEE